MGTLDLNRRERIAQWIRDMIRPERPTRPRECPHHGDTLYVDEADNRVYCRPHPDHRHRHCAHAWPASWPTEPATGDHRPRAAPPAERNM